MANNNNTQTGAGVNEPPKQVRRYFLFVHHSVKEGKIIQYGRGPTGLTEDFYTDFRSDLRYLVRILERSPDHARQQWEGRAFVFVDVGWTQMLKTEDITGARTLAQGLQRIRSEIMERLCLTECRLDTCSERRASRVAPWPVPIQIITAAELIGLLATIDELLPPTPMGTESRERPQRGKLSQYLVGGVAQLRYDASKAIEGLIRIANVGRNVPIFRFDDDVIFYGQRVYNSCSPPEKDEKGRTHMDEMGNPKRKPCTQHTWGELDRKGFLLKEMAPILDPARDRDPDRKNWPREPQERLELWYNRQIGATRDNILKLCERYDRACANPKLHYFVFSGHYKKAGTSRPEESCAADSGDDLLNGYATRVVQLANLPQCYSEAENPTKNSKAVQIEGKLACRFLNELSAIGANPFRQVVSGGGLCLSDGAVLDLPPYSNMRLNVMWIDDHLKYALHDELQHFDIHLLEVGPAREVDARFPQLRHAQCPVYKDVYWHLTQYMQRLLLGCIADAWLRNDEEKEINMKEQILPQVQRPYLPEDIEKARESRQDMRPYVYAKAFLNAVPGRPSAKKLLDLRRELWRIGVERLRKVCHQWEHEDYRGTFLGLFVWGKGERVPDTQGPDMQHRDGQKQQNPSELPREFEQYIPEHYPHGLRAAVEGIEPNPYAKIEDEELAVQRLAEESRYLDGLKPDGLRLADSLRILIDDFVGYFETVNFWSTYVRAVRFLVSRSGQNPELQWLFPPDESYQPRDSVEPIIHVLEQITDLHLDQEDLMSLMEIQGQDAEARGKKEAEPPEDWRELAEYYETKDAQGTSRPNVRVHSSEIRAYARKHRCPADVLWLIVTCYHLTLVVIKRGHGHEKTKWSALNSGKTEEFALTYMYFFLVDEDKRDALDLLTRLEEEANRERPSELGLEATAPLIISLAQNAPSPMGEEPTWETLLKVMDKKVWEECRKNMNERLYEEMRISSMTLETV